MAAITDGSTARPRSPPPELYFSEKLWSPRYGSNFYTVAIKSVGVGMGGADPAAAYYQVKVQWGAKTKTLARRYSEFFALHVALKRIGAQEPDTASLFPPKTWFPSVDPELLEIRRVQLGAWLDAVLSRTKENASRKEVRVFLGLSSMR